MSSTMALIFLYTSQRRAWLKSIHRYQCGDHSPNDFIYQITDRIASSSKISIANSNFERIYQDRAWKDCSRTINLNRIRRYLLAPLLRCSCNLLLLSMIIKRAEMRLQRKVIVFAFLLFEFSFLLWLRKKNLNFHEQLFVQRSDESLVRASSPLRSTANDS